LKPEWWGSPLAQEQKYQGRKKTCEMKKNNNVSLIPHLAVGAAH
jgi:hypothetical protein